MAIIQAPFLSLGAKGQVAKTLVASTWKGVKTMRHYVKPANPRSTKQTAQRELFANVVGFWHTVSTDEETSTAWNRLALVSGKPQSGFNAFSSNQVRLGKLTGEIVAGYNPVYTAETIGFDMKTSSVAGGSATPTFSMYEGATPDKMYKVNVQVSITETHIMVHIADARQRNVFIKLVANVEGEENPFDVTGIYPITIS